MTVARVFGSFGALNPRSEPGRCERGPNTAAAVVAGDADLCVRNELMED